jgi:hypothetical protein
MLGKLNLFSIVLLLTLIGLGSASM